MIREKDGAGEENYERILERKAVELENRRRALLEKSEIKRRLRETHIERRKATEAEELQRVKEAFDLKVQQAERDEQLAKEFALRKHYELQEAFKKKKARNAVSIVSSCTAEKIEAKLKKEKEQEEELLNSKSFSAWPYTELDADQQQEKKLSYRKELQDQLIDNHRRRREKEEEKHRERKILEEVGETLHKEDLEAEKRKKDGALLFQAERDAFLKARQIWKDKRREVIKQEHEEISRIIAKKEALRKKEVEQMTDTLATKDAIAEKVGKQIKEQEDKKLERENICREMYLAERENKLANEAVKLALIKKHTAKEALQFMESHRKSIAKKKAKEDAIDAAFAKYLADERRKLEETEKQKEQARREKMTRYGNELRETITKKRMEYLQDLAQRRSRPDGKEESDDAIAQKGKPDSEFPANRKAKCHSETVLETWKAKQPKSAVFT